MERSRKVKENIARNANISEMFRVKKSLFNQTLCSNNVKASSVNSGQQCHTSSPVTKALVQEDSPFSLFKIRKNNSSCFSKSLNYSESVPTDCLDTTPNKKLAKLEIIQKKAIGECLSTQSPNNIKLAVQKSILDPDLIGDFTKPCSLKTISGRHPDLKTISPETVASLLQGSKSISFSIVDCRYPYEYNAGHIKNAQNIFIKEDIVKLLKNSDCQDKKNSRHALIFYCEFSSERGPSMLRHLRSTDRDLNRNCYPFLYYPELYIMEGGYKAFFSGFKELCEPQEYKRMLDDNCTEELAYYRSKCKSDGRRKKCIKRTRSSLFS